MSDEIIKVLDALCEKFGIVIDWTSANVFPYLQVLCDKFIKWQIGTSIGWIVIMIILIIIGLIFSKIADLEGIESIVFWGIIVASIIVISVQAFDIIECYTFPEKAILDYIQYYNSTH